MNEIKKKYRESKKKLQERIFELEKKNHELEIRLSLIKDIANGTTFNKDQETVKEIGEALGKEPKN